VTSPIVKRSIVIAGHKTSVSIEDAFWTALKDIAHGRDTTVAELVATIDAGRQQGNLSSAIRVFVLDHFRAQGGGNVDRERARGKTATTASASTPTKQQ
jgi:predicted DNA-binding ribbon-helix-helix protein